jgi:hypothetical protein
MTTALDHPVLTPDAAPNMTVKKARTFGGRVCCECGVKFAAKHPNAQFCTPAHKLTFHNRQKGRSAAVMYAMAYRQKRGKAGIGGDSLKELCRLLDLYNAEDFAAGRPSAATYVEGLKRRDHFGTAWESRAHRPRANA